MKRSTFPIPWKDALEGCKLAIENAERLAYDSEVLMKNDRLECAFHLSLSAQEEFGKAVWLFRHWKERQDLKENQWFEILRNHRMKRIAYSEDSDILYPKSGPPKDMKEVFENMKKASEKMGKYFDFERQMALYVDWVGEWRSPTKIDRELFEFPFDPNFWISNVRLSAFHLSNLISESAKEQSSNL